MTLVPAAAILVRAADAPVRSAVFVYLAVTHLGGAGVWISVLALAHYGALCGTGDPGRARRRPGGARPDRGADRLRDQGRVDAAALLAAARPSGRAEQLLGADVGGDDQGRALRARSACTSSGSAPVPLWVGLALLARGAALLARRCPVGARAARPQAAARLQLDRERRDRRPRPRRLAALRLGGRPDLGGDRLRRGAPPRRQPRAGQGAASSSARALRARGRAARPRPSRRPPAPDAVDRRRLPGRRDGDRRAAAAERVRLRVADPAGAASTSPSAPRSASGSPGWSPPSASRRRRRWRCSASSRSVGLVLLGVAAPARGRRRDRGPRWDARRAGRPRRGLRRARRGPGARAAGAGRVRSGPRVARRRTGPLRPRRRLAPRRSWLLLGARRADRRRLVGCAARAAPRRSPPGPAGSASTRRSRWTSAGFTKPLRLVLEVVLRPRREIVVVRGGRRAALGSPTAARSRTSSTRCSIGRVRRRALAGARIARRFQSGNVRATPPTCWCCSW